LNKNLRNITIQNLAKAIANGDEQALADLYQIFYQPLLYYGLRITSHDHSHLVKEVIQELFLWVAQNHEKLNTIQNFEAYIYQSFKRNLRQKNLAKAEKRKIKERYLHRTEPLQDKLSPSPESNFIKGEEEKEKKVILQNAMAQLPPYQREILHLRYFEERDYKEIAALLSLSQQVARNYVYRALQNLRKLLK